MASPAPAATSPLERKAKVADPPTEDVVQEEVEEVEEVEEGANTRAGAAEGAADATADGVHDDTKSEDTAEEGEADESEDGPPLPNEAIPTAQDDGWDCQWDANTQAWFFHNRFTGATQWENPRVPSAAVAGPSGAAAAALGGGVPQPPEHERPAAGGYNPAIHGDYDPNAWYAQGTQHDDEYGSAATAAAAAGVPAMDGSDATAYAATAAFNRITGGFQTADTGPERHSDEAKARRQMNTYFDVDAAANAHGGRSLKAERSNKKPTKSELKAFKEKRRARKEEKRRAWLRD